MLLGQGGRCQTWGPATRSIHGASAINIRAPVHSGVSLRCRAQGGVSHDASASGGFAAELASLRDIVAEQGRVIQELRQQLASSLTPLPRDPRRVSTFEQYQQLPDRVILIRHAHSMGNQDGLTYTRMPDNAVPLSTQGRQDALLAGNKLRKSMEAKFGPKFSMFFMASPYRRSVETLELLVQAFTSSQVTGLRQEVQLREQDFGNFQDADRIKLDLDERLRYGRFWFRFPNGESGADVFDRMTMFHDHLLRDLSTGRFRDSNLVLVTHGITLRVFLMRWFHWTVAQFLQVHNPPNCKPVIMEKYPWDVAEKVLGGHERHIKQLYFITSDSLEHIPGCSSDMASHESRWSSTNSSFYNLNSSMLGLAVGGSHDAINYDPPEPPSSLDSQEEEMAGAGGGGGVLRRSNNGNGGPYSALVSEEDEMRPRVGQATESMDAARSGSGGQMPFH